MVKYRRRPVIVDIQPFKNGMEDGYACYFPFHTDRLVGYFRKGMAMPKSKSKPAIKTNLGWQEVMEGIHYIVTEIKDGEEVKYVIEEDVLEKEYELIGD